jgi:hypothetical protein
VLLLIKYVQLHWLVRQHLEGKVQQEASACHVAAKKHTRVRLSSNSVLVLYISSMILSCSFGSFVVYSCFRALVNLPVS